MTGERGWTIRESFYVTETERRAIAAWYGDDRMAPLAQVRRFVRANGTNGIEHAVLEHERAMEGSTR